MPDDRTFTRENRTAGLALSVGHAGVVTRILLAAIVLVTAGIVAVAGGAIATTTTGRIVSVALIEPLAIGGIAASFFIAAPRSRYGVWLDHFVPRLRETRVATATALILIAAGAIIVAAGRSLFDARLL